MRRTLVALALASSFGISPPFSLLDSLRHFLSALGPATSAVSKAGGGAEPNGLNAPAPPPVTDAGGGWDPFG